jgi:hypothetical protein
VKHKQSEWTSALYHEASFQQSDGTMYSKVAASVLSDIQRTEPAGQCFPSNWIFSQNGIIGHHRGPWVTQTDLLTKLLAWASSCGVNLVAP